MLLQRSIIIIGICGSLISRGMCGRSVVREEGILLVRVMLCLMFFVLDLSEWHVYNLLLTEYESNKTPLHQLPGQDTEQ